MYHVSGVASLGAESEFACGKAALHFLGAGQALTDVCRLPGANVCMIIYTGHRPNETLPFIA